MITIRDHLEVLGGLARIAPPTGLTDVEAPAAHVIEALQRVLRDMPEIGKTGVNQQSGYKFRGIDQIVEAVHELFVRHRLIALPRVVDWQRDVFQFGPERWADDRLLVAYDIYGPGGVSDHVVLGPVASTGRDIADKGAAKAMTGAQKYGLIEALLIHGGEDGDLTTPGASSQSYTSNAPTTGGQQTAGQILPEEDAARLLDALRDLSSAVQREVKQRWNEMAQAGEIPDRSALTDPAHVDLMIAARDAIVAERVDYDAFHQDDEPATHAETPDPETLVETDPQTADPEPADDPEPDPEPVPLDPSALAAETLAEAVERAVAAERKATKTKRRSGA